MRVSRWRENSDAASFVPYPGRDTIAVAAVARAVEQAREWGYSGAYTAALTPAQAEPFLESGFALFEELHLLRCKLIEEPPPERLSTRRGRRSDLDPVLALDHLAFQEFWRLDRDGLSDAIRATPKSRFEVTRTAPVLGYHVTGLAGTNAYLQRVAVHPDAQGQGWGVSLVRHSQRWAFRNGATTGHVNTQLHNERAVALYERCGFRLAPYRLQVLHRSFVT